MLAAVAAVALTPGRTLTFTDERTGYSLTMQTDPAAADARHFTFRVPGLGIYVGSAGTSMRVLTSTSVIVQYDGSASLRPITDAAGVITGRITAPQGVAVRLQAQIDPAHATAEATLTEASGAFHLASARSRCSRRRTAAARAWRTRSAGRRRSSSPTSWSSSAERGRSTSPLPSGWWSGVPCPTSPRGCGRRPNAEASASHNVRSNARSLASPPDTRIWRREMELLIAVAVLAALAGASLRWGYDSRSPR